MNIQAVRKRLGNFPQDAPMLSNRVYRGSRQERHCVCGRLDLPSTEKYRSGRLTFAEARVTN